MLRFRDFERKSTQDLPKLAKLTRLPKLPKLPKMMGHDNGENRNRNSGPTTQKVGSAQAVSHLRRIIVQLSVLVRRLSQE